MPQSSSCFFRPRIGSRYYDKWEGYRTMVVGVHLLCEEECAYKPLCTAADTVAQMDDRCPCYTTHRKGRWADYYRLSNCNAIELDTYIYKDGKSPAFSAFTKYLLHEQDGVTAERREWLWEHLCFYNFMQCFRPDSRTPAPADAPHLYDAALPAFKQVLADLRPQYLYVWSRHLADYLRSKHIEGLTYVRQTDMQAMNVHVFSYNCILSHGITESQLSLCIAARLTDDLAIDKATCEALMGYLRQCLQAGYLDCDGHTLTICRGKKKAMAYLCRMLCRALDLTWHHFDALLLAPVPFAAHTAPSSLRHAHGDEAAAEDKRQIDGWIDQR